jgi:hypothetical protein
MKTQEKKLMQISLPRELALNVAICSLKQEIPKSEIVKRALEQYLTDGQSKGE